MEKLMKTAEKLDSFFKVLQRIIKISMIVAVCVLGVLTVANFVNSDAVIANGHYSIDMGPITIKMAEAYSPEDNGMVLVYSWITIGLIIIAAVASYYAFEQVRKILQPMAQGNPFHHSVSVNIRKMAYVSIVLGIVANIASFIETFSAMNAINKLKIFETVKEGIIHSITVNYNMDLTFLIVFFILLLMSYIFHYGEELQQQVDETL